MAGRIASLVAGVAFTIASVVALLPVSGGPPGEPVSCGSVLFAKPDDVDHTCEDDLLDQAWSLLLAITAWPVAVVGVGLLWTAQRRDTWA